MKHAVALPEIRWSRVALRTACVATVGSALLVGPAIALEPEPKEMVALKACERQICTMALGRKPAGSDLSCKVSKTWAKDTLKGGEAKTMKWGFGDARCSSELKLSRADVIAALTKPEHTVEVPAHTVKCVVEREGELKSVTAKLAPKLTFKNGKASKIWINLQELDGPSTIKATVWTAAKLEDNFGIFHKSMIKSVNKFLFKQCGDRYAADGTPKPDPNAVARDAAAKAAATKASTAKAAATIAKTAAVKAVAEKSAVVETGSSTQPAASASTVAPKQAAGDTPAAKTTAAPAPATRQKSDAAASPAQTAQP